MRKGRPASVIVILCALVVMGIPAPRSDGVPGTLDITTDKCSYAVGEEVAITFANVGGTPIWWQMRAGPSGVPFTVFDGRGELAWSNETSANIPRSLNPGESRNATWNQLYGGYLNPRHGQVDPGPYRVWTWWGYAPSGPTSWSAASSAWFWIGEPCGGGSGPVADAGPDLAIPEGGSVRLDGTASRGSVESTFGTLPAIDNYACPTTFPFPPPPPPSLPHDPYESLVANGDFESGADGWTLNGSAEVSTALAYNGSHSLVVNTTAADRGFAYQHIDDPGGEYVLYLWFYLTASSADPLVIELVRNWDPANGTADVVFRVDIHPDENWWKIWNNPAYGSSPFTIGSWHRLVIALNTSARSDCEWTDSYSGVSGTQYSVTPFPPDTLVLGDISGTGHAGKIAFDNVILVGTSRMNTSEAPITSYRWDVNDRMDSDGDGNFTDDADATGPVADVTYGDDGTYGVTLMVTDAENRTATDTATVTVRNTDPRVLSVNVTPGSSGDLGLRVAGRKWNSVNLTLYEDGAPTAAASVRRMPGSPNDQIAWIRGPFNLSADHVAVVTYEPDDLGGREVGGNPVWLVAGTPDNFTVIAHHTFNVQRSEERNGSQWNHIDPWTANVTGQLGTSSRMTITATAVDNGSDDLTFTWGGVSHTYFNDGVGPDPPDSPWGTFPFTATDRIEVEYVAGMTITLTVTDDDGGAVTFVLSP